MNTIENFLKSIGKSIETENYYAALGIALAMPDICGKLEFPAKSSKIRYKEFFDKYMSEFYKSSTTVHLSSSDCYALRCSFLHEASDNIIQQNAKEILSKFKFITLPIHNLLINNEILCLNVNNFCTDIIFCVDRWLNDVKNNIDVQNRISSLIRIETQEFYINSVDDIGTPDFL